MTKETELKEIDEIEDGSSQELKKENKEKKATKLNDWINIIGILICSLILIYGIIKFLTYK